MFACLHARGNFPILRECAEYFSPLIEETSGDTVTFDIGGLDHLIGTPRQIAQSIEGRIGIPANLAIAANPDAAVHAARGIAGITIIPPGEEGHMLAPLPLNLLMVNFADSNAIAETLDSWGIRTFGELAALPPLGIAARLGAAGVYLQKLARGEGDRLLRLAEASLQFAQELELEYPVEELEPLSFLLARLLNDLCARLESRALAAHQIRLQLRLENAPDHAVALRLPVPMRDPKAFLKLLQLELSSRPPAAAILKILLAAEPVKPRVQQHGLFLPMSPEPDKMELTLARIKGLVGDGNAGTPELLETHRPDAFRMADRTLAGDADAALPRSKTWIALRRFRPAKHAQVHLRGGRPGSVSTQSIHGNVIDCAGPWRTSGEWWRSDAWNHDEWDVALSDGGIYRVYRDLATGRWFVEGSYD